MTNPYRQYTPEEIVSEVRRRLQHEKDRANRAQTACQEVIAILEPHAHRGSDVSLALHDALNAARKGAEA